MRQYLIDNNKAAFIGYAVLQTLQMAGTVGVAKLLNWMVDCVSESIASSQGSALWMSFLVCLAYAIVLGLLILLSGRAKARCIKSAVIRLKNDVMNGILSQKESDFVKKKTADYISLMNQNISVIEENYFKIYLAVFEGIVSMIFAVILLVTTNPVIAVIALMLMSIPSFIPMLFKGKLAGYQKNIAEVAAKYNGLIKDIFQGFCVIKNFCIEDKMKTEHAEKSDNMEQSKKKMADEMALLYGLANGAGVAVQFLVIAIAGFLAVHGFITIGGIIAVTQLTGQVISPAFQMSAKVSQLKGTKSVREVFESIICFKVSENARVQMRDSIELKGLNYSYGDCDVLKDVNLIFEKGKHYAIVGKSGCGKTTLIKILGGITELQEGEIVVDRDNKVLPHVTIMQQDTFLFDKSLKDNITLFKDFDDNQINKAIEQAGLKSFVEELADGLDTRVEENGSRFSGGERQRIALARALLHKEKFLLMDEATSALDIETATWVEEQLQEIKDVTIVSVTHRVNESILKLYDEIIVISEGKIAERGTYQQLIHANDIFRKMVETEKLV